MTRTGLDRLIAAGFGPWRGRRTGVLCNQASIAADYRHILEHLLPLHQSGFLEIGAVFGPQHGLFGHTQDNMIEWEGRVDKRTGLQIYSLYGEHRKPSSEMLEGLDCFAVDLQDVGSRYYTFIWTMALCLEACFEAGIPVVVLDRPNPIGGIQVEGPVLDASFSSFVGLYPLPIRHGLTIGEIASWLSDHHLGGKGDLSVEEMEGWARQMYFEATNLPWVQPSPNMPTVDTAVVYPGGCLLEGTNLSEGRGTTRPFEQFGSPFVEGFALAEALNAANLPGCLFRPIEFQPTSNKWAGELCGGVFVHVLDRSTFRPFLTYCWALREIRRLFGASLRWKNGPYEYEFEKRPIDVIAGNGWLANAIDDLEALNELKSLLSCDCSFPIDSYMY